MKKTNILKMGALAVLCAVVSAFGDAYYANTSSSSGNAFYTKTEITRTTTHHYDANGTLVGSDVTESSADTPEMVTLQPEENLNQQDFYEQTTAFGSPVDGEGKPQAYDNVVTERWELYNFDRFETI
jgi:hypothetical protein